MGCHWWTIAAQVTCKYPSLMIHLSCTVHHRTHSLPPQPPSIVHLLRSTVPPPAAPPFHRYKIPRASTAHRPPFHLPPFHRYSLPRSSTAHRSPLQPSTVPPFHLPLSTATAFHDRPPATAWPRRCTDCDNKLSWRSRRGDSSQLLACQRQRRRQAPYLGGQHCRTGEHLLREGGGVQVRLELYTIGSSVSIHIWMWQRRS